MAHQQKYEVWQGRQNQACALKRARLRQQFLNDSEAQMNGKLAKNMLYTAI